jgi:hypothetical protein
MEPIELRNPEESRAYLLDAFFLQRTARLGIPSVKSGLELALEIASEGQPLLPTGALLDFHTVAFGAGPSQFARETPQYPGWPTTLLRQYEDHVLARLNSDWSFERASDALRRYSGRERNRGLAYALKQFRHRARLGGVEVSPAVIRNLLQAPASELLAKTSERLAERGPMPLLKEQYEQLVAAARRTPELLGAEDVQAIEQRTALADLGEYVAHRQVVQTGARIEAALPRRPLKPLTGRKEVPTRVHDDDQYPVGGYSSLSNRGSIESLLHSQLAYMEPKESPDLFDVKYMRDELFYYARDENQFLRRRRAFAFVLEPTLAEARFKDPELPCQRIVLVQSFVSALVHRLADWLTDDAIRFEIHLPAEKGTHPLAKEAKLFNTLFREMRAAGTLEVVEGKADPDSSLSQLAQNAQVGVLRIGTAPEWRDRENRMDTTLAVNGAAPSLTDTRGQPVPLAGDDAFEAWIQAAIHQLQLWV